MAGVPQQTLNWLYDVLKSEYRDPNRTYSDVAQTLAQYSSLSPRTDVFTSENGVPALLFNLKGVLPVNFRGTIYRFPIALWIPHAYPYEAPIVYVTPTEDMVVRPGQHVSASDGKVYHHYLAKWKETWDRSNVVEFLKILADIFSREPPVMARPQQAPPPPALPHQPQPQQQRQQPSIGGLPPIPPPPQDPRRYGSHPSATISSGRTGSPGQAGPPPPPPKQTNEPIRPGSAGPSSSISRPGRYDAPPPLPQQGPPPRPIPTQQPYGNGSSQSQPPAMGQYMPQRTSSLRREYAMKEQPPLSQQYRPQSPGGPPQDARLPSVQSPVHSQSISSPPPPPHTYQTYSQQYAGSSNQSQPPQHIQGGQNLPQRPESYVHPSQPPTAPVQPNQWSQQPPPQRQPNAYPQQPPQVQQPVQPKITQPKDLLSEDDPFQVSLPTSTPKSNLPAPPIPINPEKTALLSHLSHVILQRLHTSVQQSQITALPSLQSQHAALSTASQTLTSELHQLQSLSSQLQSNISALQSTITSANTTIQQTQDPKHASHPDNIPPVDQIIIPPTVVARQLYDAVAEQRGYEAAIFALNEAFVRGRIGAELWGRKVRECAREEMKRKWLVQKIGNGLGLEEH